MKKEVRLKKYLMDLMIYTIDKYQNRIKHQGLKLFMILIFLIAFFRLSLSSTQVHFVPWIISIFICADRNNLIPMILQLITCPRLNLILDGRVDMVPYLKTIKRDEIKAPWRIAERCGHEKIYDLD